uniref:Uncharacterized protein n=1 Tax=Kalanchoe fedtschenkoi TaxID=63787 RepID=A0A7N0TMD5_KALFE
MSAKKKKKQSKLKQLLKSPGKIFSSARDLYVKSMVMFNAQMGSYGGGGLMGCPTTMILPRSFSAGSSIRWSSAPELVRRKAVELARTREKTVMGRSCSVGVGRIDEDEVCEFGEEVVMVFRTRSHADRRGGIVQ